MERFLFAMKEILEDERYPDDIKIELVLNAIRAMEGLGVIKNDQKG